MKLRDTLKEFLQKPYESIDSFLENVIFPVFGEDNFVSAGNSNVLRRYPDLQTIANDNGILSLIQVGSILIDGQELNIFDIKVNSHRQLSRSRVAIQSLVRKLIPSHSNAFMIFHYDTMEGRWDWRFTFCQKGASNADSTDAKRYTFLLGPSQSCRTAADNFMKIHDKIERDGELEMDDIVSAFDVEALSNEFFDKYVYFYKEYFVKYMCDEANSMRQDFITTDFDHTGLTPEQIKDKEEKPIRDYLKKLLGRLVFLQFLQKKGWMGVPVDKEWGEGNYDFLRQLFLHATPEQKDNFLDGVLEPLFTALDTKRTDDIYDTQVPGIGKVKIPYLNGGLFERDSADEPDTKFPAEYFGELLEFFYAYNFTIDENDPNDAEVGVDPEMLGKIFESQLEDNKDKGAFYTPKEIVQYMCKESLIAYLISEAQQGDNQSDDAIEEKVRVLVDNPEAAIDTIKSYGTSQLQVLNDALVGVKICDPAIGSGAFPMGLLNLLFKCRLTLNEALEIDTHPAELKKDIIQNNIYGVDIEKGAIDIARLRFWLSIVVDLDAPEALPNFDYKFMQGNSLLEQYHGVDLSAIAKEKKAIHGEMQITMFEDDLDCLRREMRSKVSEYFYVTDHQKKYQLREEIFENVKQQIAAQHINVIFPNDYDISANTDFFLWHTWFADVFNRPSKQGFDIVIGNPPYGANIDKLVKTYAKLYPKTSCGFKDIYKYFIEIGFRLLRSNGFLTFITPNTFIRQPRYGDVRRLMLENSIWKIVDLGEDIFKAVVPVAIFLSQKCNGTKVLMADMTKDADIRRAINNIRYSELSQNIFENTVNNIFVKPVELNVQTKLLSDILEMKDCGFKYQRSNVGLSQKGKNDLADRIFYTGNLEDKRDTRILIGKDIYAYYHCIHPNKVLRHNYNELLRENEGTYYNKRIMAAPKKIIWRQTAPYFIGTILKEPMFFGNTIQAGILREEYQNSISYEYLCGLLNSTYLRSLYIHNVQESGRVFPQVKLEKLKPLPIVIAKKEEQRKIESLVEQIITAKSLDPQLDTSALEKEIDNLVYYLYNLTENEIRLLEQV